MTMHGRFRLFLLLLAGLAFSAFAADGGTIGDGRAGAAETGEAEMAEAQRVAQVVVDGVTLFRVRGISAFPAERRAGAIAARIVEVARDARIVPDAIKIEERNLGSAIVAGQQVLLTVHDADAQLESVRRDLVAAAYADAIARAIARYRSDREPRVLATSAAYALGAFAALAVALYGLLRLHRRVDAMLGRRYRERLENLKIQGFKVLHAEHLWRGLHGLVGVIHALIALVCVYLALNFALAQFPATRGVASGLLEAIVAPLAAMGHALLASIPNLVFLVVLVLVTRYVLKTLQLFFGAVESGSVTLRGFDREWSWPTYRIVRLLVVAFAVVVAYPYIPGSDSAAFKGVSLFLGVIFSLGSSSIIANIIAGYSMTYRRAFRVGDRIKVGDIVGDVTEVRLQVTHVRSPKNEDIVIPNSVILNNHVVNYSSSTPTATGRPR